MHQNGVSVKFTAVILIVRSQSLPDRANFMKLAKPISFAGCTTPYSSYHSHHALVVAYLLCQLLHCCTAALSTMQCAR
jgi:hypothetical protein